ncbi:MAG TPA: immunoglobulin domain-containing protein [Candidatus Paceibacterota bacterium]|nr:immunoglobulin domain-containing protein [Verrucomicrobiota bacterium]HRY46427.1 immunoglobulin domain-containing protein [Candidatus Paceibacterota bacterium]HRZ99380.1 immunoglobulin domain-containing protein [Candidatus Paceibacterota bacterium]
MNYTSAPFKRNIHRIALFGVVAAMFLCPRIHGQSIPNPSFEADSFAVAPGYVSDNSPITGWTDDAPWGAGLNPAGGVSQFADNGTIPDGNNVAFISGGTTLSTTITGLTAGKTYKVTFQANAPTSQAPVLRASIDGQEVLAVTVYPAGDTGPYGYLAFEFTAAAASAAMSLFNDAGSDVALLVDNFKVALSSGKWTVTEWADDATIGVAADFVYSHAYSFGSAANLVINGIPFTGVAGANPAVADKFSTAFMGNVFNNDANTVTGDGAALARDFVYSGANVSAGSFQSITVKGLTPGTEYVASIYSVGFDSPGPTIRWATISVGEDRLTINQDQFGNDHGICMSYRYTADTEGTVVLKLAPVNPVNVSIHIYGFSNREAVSRNVAPSISQQPASTTVAQGVPVDFAVAATGFPSPTYQWRFNGANITGATAAHYRIESASSQNAGQYDVVVANSMGSITSAEARLTIGLPMNNPSFEEDSFLSWPGYSGDNVGNANTPPGPNIPITGWTQSDLAGSGINPISNGESPFADNGIIPNGKQVIFIQSDSTINQTVSGLTAGSQYYVHYYENSRTTVTPSLEVQIDTTTLIPAHAVPAVRGSNPYREVYSDVFTASAASIDLAFAKSNPLGGDSTVLIDNVAIVPVPPGTTPLIVRNPENRQVVVGDTNTFSLQFVGSLPATYQWLKNGSPISGETGPTLTLKNIQTTDEADYSVTVSNTGGTVTSASAHLTVISIVPTVYGTGLAPNRSLLAAGEVDPHYRITTSPDLDFPGPDALVVNDAWPVQAGVWLLNGPDSKWIAPQADQATGNAEGDYVYTTTFDLTGFDLSRIKLAGAWAVDNTGTDILLNGNSTGFTSAGFDSLTPFTITNGFVPGVNTLVFKVTNLPATPNPTAIRVDLRGIIVTSPPAEAKIEISRNGATITISWAATPAGQELQSAADLNGPWTEVPGAASPYTVTPTGAAMFFRTVR